VSVAVGELTLAEQIIQDFLAVSDKVEGSWNSNFGKGTFEEKRVCAVILSYQDRLYFSHNASVP